MPYIKSEYRDSLDPRNRDAYGVCACTPGDLNFQITCLIKEYWDRDYSYQTINDIIGALEGAKMEFYRRVAVPYEEQKRSENGDVYAP